MNQVVFFIQHLPGSLIGGIWITGWGVAALYLAVGFLGAAFRTRQLKWAIAALAIFTGLGIYRLERSMQQEKQQELVIYSISRHTLIDFFDGRRTVCLSDSLTKKQVTFTAQSNRWALGAQETLPFLLSDSLFQARNCCFDPPFVQFFDRKMLILDNAHWLHDQEVPAFPVDMILLSNNPKVNIADCIRRFPCRLIVSDGTNSWKQCDRWRTECANLGLSYHDIRSDGAYVWSN